MRFSAGLFGMLGNLESSGHVAIVSFQDKDQLPFKDAFYPGCPYLDLVPHLGTSHGDSLETKLAKSIPCLIILHSSFIY